MSVASDFSKAVRIRIVEEDKYENESFSEELIAYVLPIARGTAKKTTRPPTLILLCIRCRENVFTKDSCTTPTVVRQKNMVISLSGNGTKKILPCWSGTTVIYSIPKT
jgi:hypothetical protein